jgi:riboflavin kinase / FMN adenylyltransferase
MMEVIRNIQEIPENLKGAVATIGNFDGVHLGHRFIFQRLVEEARREDRPAVAISFDPHPKMVLHPERRPFYLITTLREKIGLLDALGLDAFILIPFSLEYARTTAEEFVRETLWEKLRVRRILIGHDYTFGRGKEGNEAFLTETGRRLGFEVEVINAHCVGGTVISSTKIREALLAGDVGFASTLLGRPYNLAGRVVAGSRRGVRLGSPRRTSIPTRSLSPPAAFTQSGSLGRESASTASSTSASTRPSPAKNRPSRCTSSIFSRTSMARPWSSSSSNGSATRCVSRTRRS